MIWALSHSPSVGDFDASFDLWAPAKDVDFTKAGRQQMTPIDKQDLPN